MNFLYVSSLRRTTVLGLAFTGLLGSAITMDAAGPSRVRQVSARNLTSRFVGEPVAAGELRPVERSFLLKAVAACRSQLRLAEIGVSHAASSDVRSYAQQLVNDYRSLSDALDELIRRRGGIAGAPVGGSSETYQKLLQQPSGEFDRQFVRTVARATADVLTAFEQITSESKDADVRELAAAQLPVLRAHQSEITQLQKAVD